MADPTWIDLWDLRDPRRPRRLGTTDSSGVALGAIQFARDGDTLVGVGGDRVLRLWDASDPRKPRLVSKRPTGHTAAVCSVAVRRDGVAATSSYDDTVRLRDLSDPAPRVLDTLTGHDGNVKAVAVSPDGKTLTSGSDDREWDVTDPHHANTVAVLEGQWHFVDAVAYSPDGRTLLSGSDDHTAKLWDIGDLPRHRELGELARHADIVTGVAFASHGRTAATVGVDGARLGKHPGHSLICGRTCLCAVNPDQCTTPPPPSTPTPPGADPPPPHRPWRSASGPRRCPASP